MNAEGQCAMCQKPAKPKRKCCSRKCASAYANGPGRNSPANVQARVELMLAINHPPKAVVNGSAQRARKWLSLAVPATLAAKRGNAASCRMWMDELKTVAA